MLHTTFALLRRFRACGQNTPDGSYNRLRASLPMDYGDDAPIPLLHVLESNGIDDAIWALRATVEPTGKDMAREMACRAAERVLPIFEKLRSEDKRPREAIKAARAYAERKITLDQLHGAADAAASAYTAVDAAAYAAAFAAYAAASAAASAYTAVDAAAYAAAFAAYAADAEKAEKEVQAKDYRELLSQF